MGANQGRGRSPAGRIWEPAAGDGAIVKELRRAGYSVTASDISDYGLPGCMIADYLLIHPPLVERI